MDFQEIEIGLIHAHKSNPRHDLGSVTELAASIKAQGLIEPLIVAPSGDDFGYVLIAGHRRLEAGRKAKLTILPCIVRADLTGDAEQLEAMLVENLQRTNLTAVEEAEAYQSLLEFPDYTIQRITKATGRSAKTVKQRLQIAELPADAKERVHTGQLTLADALKISEFATEPEMFSRLAKAVGTANFSYALSDAKRRSAKIAEAVEAGAEVLTTGGDVTKAYPNAVQVPWSSSGRKPGPGMVLVYPPVSYGGTLYYIDPPAEEQTPEPPAGNPKAGGSMVEKSKRKDEFKEQQRLSEQLQTARATRIAYLASVIAGNEAPEQRLDKAAESMMRWLLKAQLVEYTFDAVDADLLDVQWVDDRAKVLTLMGETIDDLDLPHLAFAAAAMFAQSFPDPDLQSLTGWGNLAEPVKDWLFQLREVWGYQWSDVELEELKKAEAAEQNVDES
ncbi:MAG TPA: ParB/RepB/Spo0J family partition protein [Mycobacterium sp.]|jgi:ParB family chromosome partitioning protein|uniref:ParB/RepB/Spo0J family partition protein n=1 Tax=Mycobacterium sp. TaxID=1785 RepID=UPI002F4286C2